MNNLKIKLFNKICTSSFIIFNNYKLIIKNIFLYLLPLLNIFASLGGCVKQEARSMFLVSSLQTPVQFHSLSLPSFYSCQNFNFPFRLHVFLSLSLFVLKRVQVFSSAASRSRSSHLDPTQAPSHSSLFHSPSTNSIRRLQIRFFDFHFLDSSHYGGRECSDHHERSPNCELLFSFDFLFPRTFVYSDQFTVIALEARTRTLACDDY